MNVTKPLVLLMNPTQALEVITALQEYRDLISDYKNQEPEEIKANQDSVTFIQEAIDQLTEQVNEDPNDESLLQSYSDAIDAHLMGPCETDADDTRPE